MKHIQQYILSKIREDKIKIYEYILIKVDLTKSNCFQQKVLRQHYLVIQSETFALYRVFQKQNQIYKRHSFASIPNIIENSNNIITIVFNISDLNKNWSIKTEPIIKT